MAISVELEDVAKTILDTVIDISEAKAGLLYGKHGESFILLADCGIDKTNCLQDSGDPQTGELGRKNGLLPTGRHETLGTQVVDLTGADDSNQVN